MSTTRTLLIDADDTLWENNIYFERVIRDFVAALVKRGHSAARADELLWQAEHRNVKIAGYGSKAFCQSLHHVAKELGTADLEPWIAEQENWIFHHPIQLMPGVAETLPLLRVKNRLIVVTEGREDEQLGKLRRSGLEPFFHATEVVFEKDVQTYRATIAKYTVPPPPPTLQ